MVVVVVLLLLRATVGLGKVMRLVIGHLKSPRCMQVLITALRQRLEIGRRVRRREAKRQPALQQHHAAAQLGLRVVHLQAGGAPW